tara:strand:+ start:292 stop:1506 length:1215 start_codon:yes stop_codon:yes gene_type:complete
MANLLNGFLDNVVSGALNPNGNLADKQHAARLYVDDSHRLSPKVKFLYHVSFNINREAASVIPQLAEKHLNELNMLVKSVTLPQFNIQTDVKHQYNRKRVVQKRIDYAPITMVFHDDAFGVTTAMWEAYYRYYYRDGNYAKVTPDGSVDATITEYQVPSQFNRGNMLSKQMYRYGFDNDSFQPFFNSITISQLSRKRYTSMTLINPIINQWSHDTMDNSASEPVANTMSLEYETVHYSRGPIKNGSPKGFGEEHYDKTASPISLAGGGAGSLLGAAGVLAGGGSVLADIQGGNISFGTVLKAANTLQNAGNLTQSGIGGELLGSAVDAIGQTTGIDVSGVAGVAFPKGGGGGGGLSTIATAAAVVGGGKLINDFMNSGASSSKAAPEANANDGPRYTDDDYVGP